MKLLLEKSHEYSKQLTFIDFDLTFIDFQKSVYTLESKTWGNVAFFKDKHCWGKIPEKQFVKTRTRLNKIELIHSVDVGKATKQTTISF